MGKEHEGKTMKDLAGLGDIPIDQAKPRGISPAHEEAIEMNGHAYLHEDIPLMKDIPMIFGRNHLQLILAGATAQAEKLEENLEKGDPCSVGAEKAYELYLEEHEEIREAYAKIWRSGIMDEHIDRLKELRREAADGANCLHMLIVACDRKLQEYNDTAYIRRLGKELKDRVQKAVDGVLP